jgi:glycine/D-amino acid oxidase-like deaminating enzyme
MNPANVPLWEDGSNKPLPSLTGEARAEVCVVGLGGSGLAALQELHSLGVSAIGLDARSVGAGAAGRNGGFLLAGLADFFHRTVVRLGAEVAAAIYRETVAEIQRQAREFPGIIQLTGSLRLASDPEELQDCRQHLAALKASGFPAGWYSGTEGEGLLLASDGVVQPLARLRTMAARLWDQGFRLFEHSPATRLCAREVVTGAGAVRCDAVIVAVDGSLERILPELSSQVRTARLQMLATAPAPEVSFPRPVYWRYGYEYWQQCPDRSIALGGFRDHALAAEWTHDGQPTECIQCLLEQFLRERLRVTAPVTHRWAATVSYTQNGLPILAEVRPRLWAVGGYNGTGNIVGVLCGRAAARKACGAESTWADLMARARVCR